MKNLLIFLILLITLISPLALVSSESSRGGARFIIISDNQRTTPSTIERSLLPTIEASIDYDMQHVEFVFNKSVGDVNIAIVNDMGQAVGGATCNTSMESIKYISAPTDAGSYTITISGNDYEGEGYYSIMGDSSEF